jgi:hypothetical protein
MIQWKFLSNKLNKMHCSKILGKYTWILYLNSKQWLTIKLKNSLYSYYVENLRGKSDLEMPQKAWYDLHLSVNDYVMSTVHIFIAGQILMEYNRVLCFDVL